MKMLSLLSMCGYAAALSGCISGPVDPLIAREVRQCGDDHRLIDPSRLDSSLLAARPSDRYRDFRTAELGLPNFQHLYDDATHRPKSCIALSGGGQRSAAFAIGVLSEVHRRRQGALAQTAYIGATSGGGYALGWLVHQVGQSNASIDAVLDPRGPAIQTVARASPDGVTSGPSIVAGAVTAPLALGRGYSRFGATVQENSYVKTFGIGGLSYSLALCEQFLRTSGSFVCKAPELTEVKRRWEASSLPYPIWTTTALPLRKSRNHIEDSVAMVPASYCPALRSSSFEWTLDAFGNTHFGYMNHKDFQGGSEGLTLSVPMVVSGAAVDNPAGRRQLSGAAILQFRADMTGRPGIAVEGGPIETDLWLLDGGYVDNLGVLPLIMRGCSNLLIVDGEHDPFVQFDAYRQLHQNLRETFDLDLRFPDLEKVISGQDKCAKETNAGGRWQWIKSNYSTSSCSFRADQYPKWPVYVGEINAPGGERSSAIYLKLGVPANLTSMPVGAELAADMELVRKVLARDEADTRFGDTGCVGSGASERCRFPQDSTMNQSLAESEWRAYMALGRLIAGHALAESATSGGLSPHVSWIEATAKSLSQSGTSGKR